MSLTEKHEQELLEDVAFVKHMANRFFLLACKAYDLYKHMEKGQVTLQELSWLKQLHQQTLDLTNKELQ